MREIHHSRDTLSVPAGFSGWWCERCEKPVNLPEELEAPARCPRCHKPTALWIPEVQSGECRVQSGEWKRTRPTEEEAHRLFEEMRRAAGTDGT